MEILAEQEINQKHREQLREIFISQGIPLKFCRKIDNSVLKFEGWFFK